VLCALSGLNSSLEEDLATWLTPLIVTLATDTFNDYFFSF